MGEQTRTRETVMIIINRIYSRRGKRRVQSYVGKFEVQKRELGISAL